MTISLDRFSQAGPGEGLKPSLSALEEQRELIKKDIIHDFVENYFDDTGILPDIDLVLDIFSKVDLDPDMIQAKLDRMEGTN
jgi:hypothetical protein